MLHGNSEWQLAYASVRGKSHIDGNIPNQDALHAAQSPDGSCLVLAISDGAGSARLAEQGAQHFSRFVGERVLSLVQSLNRGPTEAINRNSVGDQILQIITEARQALDPSGVGLKDYACNLMVFCIGPRAGLRVHLGDAVLLKSNFELTPDRRADYFVSTRMTAQDRAEYANETHFITQSTWTSHLQWDFIDPKGPEDMYALMTDGAGDVALANVPGNTDRRVFRGFFAPLVAQVLRAPTDKRHNVVFDALNSPQTYRLTGDDKTLALVIRKRAWDMAALDPVVDDASVKVNLQTPTGTNTHLPAAPQAAPPAHTPTAAPQAQPSMAPAPKPASTTNPPAPKPGPEAPADFPPVNKGNWHWVAGLALGVLIGGLSYPAYLFGQHAFAALKKPATEPEAGETKQASAEKAETDPAKKAKPNEAAPSTGASAPTSTASSPAPAPAPAGAPAPAPAVTTPAAVGAASAPATKR